MLSHEDLKDYSNVEINISVFMHPSILVLDFSCYSVYLSVLDPVFEGLLEKIEGVLLSVGLHHHLPGILHLNLHSKRKQLIMQPHG